MNSFSRFLLIGLCLSLATSARAQRAEIDSSPPSPAVRTSAPTPPAFTVHESGSSKAILFPFRPYITQTGVGAGGANVSELYTTFTLGAVGYNIYGYGMQGSLSIHVADDFTVPAAQSWTLSSIKWLAYQTGASTMGTITSMHLNLWNTNPLGQVPGGQSTAGGDQFLRCCWTGVYRVLDSGVSAVNRAVMQVNCSAAWVPLLSPGTYWLEAYSWGTLTSGPWAPPAVKAGQVPPTGDPWNGMQSVSAGAFAQVYDTGNPLGSINEPSDFLFQLEGTGGGGGITTFCTSKTSSLGCTPTLTATSTSVSKSGAPAVNVIASPVPGGAGLPGLLIYAKTAPSAPVFTSFGFLCLSGFSRAGAFPASPGGVSGSCSGVYTWNLAAIAAGTAGINVGDLLRIQAWYRDPGFPPPGNANLTHGIDAVVIAPDLGDGADSCTPPPPPPTGSSISPSSGGAGTVVTVSGSNFGSIASDLKLLLADGNGFADVTSASGSSLTAVVFNIGTTATGPVTVIRGDGLALPNQNFVGPIHGNTSNSSLVAAIVNGLGNNFSSYNLSPSTPNTISAKTGSPSSSLAPDLAPLTGNAMKFRLAIKFVGGEFRTFEGRIDFVNPPTPDQRAEHLAGQLNASFGTLGVSASASSSSVRISMAGAAYGGIVVAGI